VEKYWNVTGKAWVFSAMEKVKKVYRPHRVIRLSSLGIRRHVKIQADANPYMPEYGAYFHLRRHHKASRLLPAMSMREYQAKIAKGEVSGPGCPTRASFANA